MSKTKRLGDLLKKMNARPHLEITEWQLDEIVSVKSYSKALMAFLMRMKARQRLYDENYSTYIDSMHDLEEFLKKIATFDGNAFIIYKTTSSDVLQHYVIAYVAKQRKLLVMHDGKMKIDQQFFDLCKVHLKSDFLFNNQACGLNGDGNSTIYAILYYERLLHDLSDVAECLKNFANAPKPFPNAIQAIKTDLKLSLIGNSITALLAADSTNEAVKLKVRNFVDILLIGNEIDYDDYERTMREECEQYEKDENYVMDEAKIKAARSKLDDSLKEMNLDDSSDIVEVNEDDLKNFGAVINYLKNIEMTNHLRNIFNAISLNYGIDNKKLLQFFEVISKTASNEAIEVNEVSLDALPTVVPAEIVDLTDFKRLEQILAEIHTKSDLYNLTIDEFKEIYASNDDLIKIEGQIGEIKRLVCDWSMEDINKWAKLQKGKIRDDFLLAIAYMCRANYLVTGYEIRDTQLVSLLSYLNTEKNVFLQIHTGEGKTTVISLLATLEVLRGETVDVITTNQILAGDAVRTRKDFYKIFGVTIETNEENKHRPTRLRKHCYLADIVVGDIATFQFDHLSDVLEQYGTLCERKKRRIIIDEVDNIVIDNGSYIAKIAQPYPGVEILRYVYIKIWIELRKIEDELLKKFKKERDDILQVEQPSKQLFDRIKVMLLNTFSEIEVRLKEASILDKIKFLPKHLMNYAERMMVMWKENAFAAQYKCHINEQYIIRKIDDGKDVIIPMDYQNTGVMMKNTVWSNGLHQFLQLKHNLEVAADSLTSAFISNIEYVKLYDKKYGMSGTLGSEAEQELLGHIYDITYQRIPTHKMKSFEEYSGFLIEDRKWLDLVAIETVLCLYENRSVLIICETIKDVLALEATIRGLCELEKLKASIETYADEESSEIVHVEVGCLKVIIATNIAGRGTDIKTSDALESFGGLHVIVAYLPRNQRVEEQAFGRTSRCGKNGSAQLIIRLSEINDYNLNVQHITFDDIKRKRNELEKMRLKTIQEAELKNVLFMDKLFNEFTEFYRSLKKKWIKEPGQLYLCNDLKECWAFFLNEIALINQQGDQENVKNLFEEFKSNASGIHANEKISFNAYYCVQQAEFFMENCHFDKAKASLERAIDLGEKDGVLLAGAYIKFFEIVMKEASPFKERLKQALLGIIFIDSKFDETYKEQAITWLEKAQKSLEVEIDYMKPILCKESSEIRFILIPNENQVEEDENLLTKQFSLRLTSLNAFYEQIKLLLVECRKDKMIVLNMRVPKCLTELKQLTDMTNIAELEHIGLSVMYAVREVRDIPKTIVIGSRIQISSGMTILASCIACPVALPVLGPLAATLITEAILDLVFELMTHGGAAFSLKTYWKNKAISYSISLLTLGLNVLATCTKIIEEAIVMLQRISTLLRNMPHFKFLCNHLATIIDYLAKSLQAILISAKAAQNANRLYAARTVFKMVGMNLMNAATHHVFDELIISPILNTALKKLRPQIEAAVRANVLKNINREKMVNITKDDLDNILFDVMDNASLTILLYNTCRSWYKKAGGWSAKGVALLTDLAISGKQIYSYTDKFCKEFNKKLEQLTISRNEPTMDFNKQIDVIVRKVSDKVYGIVFSCANTQFHTFIAEPTKTLISHMYTDAYEDPSIDNEDQQLNEYIIACQTLGVSPDAPDSEKRAAWLKLTKKYHPGQGLTPNQKLMMEINGAYQCVQQYRIIESKPQLALPSYDAVHKGNMKTLSSNLEVTFVIKDKSTGDIIERIGDFTDTIEVDYQNEHYTTPDDVVKRLGPSASIQTDTDCFYIAIQTRMRELNRTDNLWELRNIAERQSDDNSLYDRLVSNAQLLKSEMSQDAYDRVMSSMLVGGREQRFRRKPLLDDHYPSTGIVIHKDTGSKQLMADFYNQFLDGYKRYEYYSSLSERDKLTFRNNAKHLPIFSHIEDKTNFMLGLIRVEYKELNTGQEKSIKLATISGTGGKNPEPFNTRVRVDKYGEMSIQADGEIWKFDNNENYQFVDPAQINKQNIINLESGCQMKMKYSEKCCAAQKGFYSAASILQEIRKHNPEIEIKKVFCIETYFDPKYKHLNESDRKLRSDEVIIEQSCGQCHDVLKEITRKTNNK